MKKNLCNKGRIVYIVAGLAMIGGGLHLMHDWMVLVGAALIIAGALKFCPVAFLCRKNECCDGKTCDTPKKKKKKKH